MCGRFALTANAETIQSEFNLTECLPDLPPRYNIAPTQDIAVVINQEGTWQLDAFRWGLIPFWAKNKSIGNKMINARAETIAEKPSFKRPLKRQRCLIMANGFYEWQKTPNGKMPIYIHLKNNRLICFAGLWERWQDPQHADEEVIYSCTIITTTPNQLMAPLHHRMPVILPLEARETWLNPVEQPPQKLQPLLKPYPAELMTYYPVSKLVNSPANDVAECIHPLKQ